MRVLLDTSFLLPSLGIETGPEVYKGLRRLKGRRAEIFYSGFSLLEALWIAVRLMKRGAFDEGTFRTGLVCIISGQRYTRVEETPEVLMEALRLYELGHTDLIDNVLYADARWFGLKLLTVDEELRRFIVAAGLENVLLAPDEI